MEKEKEGKRGEEMRRERHEMRLREIKDVKRGEREGKRGEGRRVKGK